MDQIQTDSQASSATSPSSSGGRNLPKFEVSAVNEANMKEEPNEAEDGFESGGIIVIKSIEDADTSAVSPFIVSLPSEEGFHTFVIHKHIYQIE